MPEGRSFAPKISMAGNIHKTIDLMRSDKPLTAEAIRSLSDLSSPELILWKAAWPAFPADRRLLLMTRLGESSETNFDLNFSGVARHALIDPDDEIRLAALSALWDDEEPALLILLMRLAQHDDSTEVRAQAVGEMGRFILLGELEKLGSSLTKDAQELAIRIYNDVDEPIEVRRRAIEALGNCTRNGISEMIQDAYDSDEPKMRVSAIHAMGRSYDQDWSEIVLQELDNPDPEIRYEAARAAGELELEEAIPVLGRLLFDEDREVLEVAVWSLGELGGATARRLLETAQEQAEAAGDEGLLEAIDEALDAANFVGQNLRFE
jgi:HEAT repeat protein